MNITIQEYADIRRISKQAVTKMIREKNSLPHVRQIHRFGRAYVLQVKKDFVEGKKDLVV